MCVVSERADVVRLVDSEILKDCNAAVFLMEPSELTLLAVSANLCRQTRRSAAELTGQSMERALQHGLPPHAVSRSANSKIEAYCQACAEQGLFRNGEVACVQACQRGDGTRFVAYQLFHSCQVQGRCLVLCVQLELCEGDRPDMKTNLAIFLEEARAQLMEALKNLGCPLSLDLPALDDEDVGFRFYSVRLQEQSMLLDHGRTCQRREFDVLPRGAQVFGDRPIQPEAGGLRFAVRVDAASKAFYGLPFLGFTRRAPTDCGTLYPDVATNMAQSLLIGGDGGASARDQPSHFKSGFKAPPQNEVETFSLQSDLPRHQRRAPAEPEVGDILECRYTWQGRLQMLRNDQMLMDFDTGRPLTEEAAYYAVVDVAFAAKCLSLVAPSSTWPDEACSGMSPDGSTCCDDAASLLEDQSSNGCISMTTTRLPSMELLQGGSSATSRPSAKLKVAGACCVATAMAIAVATALHRRR